MSETTARGFPAPKTLAERTLHADDAVYVVRLTKYERDCLRAETSGVVGRFCLLPGRDNALELVKYADS